MELYMKYYLTIALLSLLGIVVGRVLGTANREGTDGQFNAWDNIGCFCLIVFGGVLVTGVGIIIFNIWRS